ncbi:MAG: Tir chaperone protein (CesT) family [Planctomycetota bacterium]|jgi:hypothetical protein
MTAQPRLLTLLRELTESLGLPPLQPEAAGRYQLSFDFRLRIEFVHLTDYAALIVSRCGRTAGIDEVRREQLLNSCLKLSLARIPESPAVITIDSRTSDLLLYQLLDLQSISAEQFQSDVESFVNELNLWMQFIAGKLQTSAPLAGRNEELMIRP